MIAPNYKPGESQREEKATREDFEETQIAALSHSPSLPLLFPRSSFFTLPAALWALAYCSTEAAAMDYADAIANNAVVLDNVCTSLSLSHTLSPPPLFFSLARCIVWLVRCCFARSVSLSSRSLYRSTPLCVYTLTFSAMRSS